MITILQYILAGILGLMAYTAGLLVAVYIGLFLGALFGTTIELLSIFILVVLYNYLGLGIIAFAHGFDLIMSD